MRAARRRGWTLAGGPALRALAGGRGVGWRPQLRRRHRSPAGLTPLGMTVGMRLRL